MLKGIRRRAAWCDFARRREPADGGSVRLAPGGSATFAKKSTPPLHFSFHSPAQRARRFPATPAGAALIAAALGMMMAGAPRLAAQGVVAITINNPSFESPTPALFANYTLGATGWTATRSDTPAGTFSPGVAGVTPGPIDGAQVGFANGFGGLQQVLATTFAAGSTYYFSANVGVRSDEVAATGTGAIELGYLLGNGNFNMVTAQSAVVARGNFTLVSGSYQAVAGDAGQTLVVRLMNGSNPQVIFDVVQLSASPIPEPAGVGAVFGMVALLGAMAWKRRRLPAKRGV